jgi:hypothetical protein
LSICFDCRAATILDANEIPYPGGNMLMIIYGTITVYRLVTKVMINAQSKLLFIFIIGKAGLQTVDCKKMWKATEAKETEY